MSCPSLIWRNSWLLTVFLSATSFGQNDTSEKIRLAVAGLPHTHVHWIFESERNSEAFEIVGIVEPNQDLAQQYSRMHGFPMEMVYPTHELLVQNCDPHGVTAFGSILNTWRLWNSTLPGAYTCWSKNPWR